MTTNLLCPLVEADANGVGFTDSHVLLVSNWSLQAADYSSDRSRPTRTALPKVAPRRVFVAGRGAGTFFATLRPETIETRVPRSEFILKPGGGNFFV